MNDQNNFQQQQHNGMMMQMMPPDQQQQQQQQQQQPHGPSVKLSLLIHRLVEQSYNSLIELSTTLQKQSDMERKRQLVEYLDATRERFVKLLVVMKWSPHVNTLKKANEMTALLEQHEGYFRETADTLIMTKESLLNARAPIYDVPTAIDILSSGNYMRMPTDIKKVLPPPPLTSAQIISAQDRLNNIISYKLFGSDVPKEFNTINVYDGKAHIMVTGEYEVFLTVDGGNEASNWLLSSFKIFVIDRREKDTQLIKGAYDTRMAHISECIQNRLFLSQRPLHDMHDIIQYLNINAKMDTLVAQIEALKKNSQRGNLRCNYNAKDNIITIFYWIPDDMVVQQSSLDDKKNINTKIFISDNKLSISHVPPVSHPTNSTFLENFTTLSLESALLRAISLHSYQRLHQLYVLLVGSSTASSSSCSERTDVRLVAKQKQQRQHQLQHVDGDITKHEAEEETTDSVPSLLTIQLFGINVLDISINAQSGRYILLSNLKRQNILPGLENKINNDANEIQSIVNILKLKSLLEYFQESALFLKLESFFKIPLACDLFIAQQEPNYVCIRFPKDRDIFYLVITVHTQTFVPTFHLIYSRPTPQSSIMQLDSIIKLENEELSSMQSQFERGELRFNAPLFHSFILGLLAKLVLLSKKRINVQSAIQYLNSRQIPHHYDSIADESITFLALPQHSTLQTRQMAITFPDDSHCSISFHELNPQQHYNYSTAPQQQQLLQSHNNHNTYPVVYTADGQWTFTYNTCTDWLTQFQYDVAAVNRMMDISTQIVHQLHASEFASPFNIIHVQPLEVEVAYNSKNDIASMSTLRLFHNRGGPAGRVCLDFQPFRNPLLAMFENELNETLSVEGLLRNVAFANDIVYYIHSIITSNNHYVQPLELMVVPRSPTQLRLHYKNTFGIDIKMMSPDNRSRPQPIPNFPQFMEYKLSAMALNNLNGQRSSWLMSTKQLQAPLEKIILYLNSAYVVKHFQTRLRTESSSFRIITDQLTFHIFVRDYVYFELDVSNKTDQTPSLSKNEMDLLSAYFKKRVNTFSSRIQTISSFLEIFSVPPFIISELLRLLRGPPASTAPNMPKYQMDIIPTNTKVKDPVIHSREKQCLQLIVRYYIKTSELSPKITSDLLVDLPVLYYYKLNTVRYWNLNDRANPESANGMTSSDQSNQFVVDMVRSEMDTQQQQQQIQPNAASDKQGGNVLFTFATNVVKHLEKLKGIHIPVVPKS
ncbi:hypothetical protein SAMD00019534_015440 [Acytostelium subglobosum LB1]|uniref:hypothetical protein n=1 Tax=Acytostelium subglobosum LB1 TaxID=1410327 RepID=UPI000644E5B2|nr:hypothetical protein SAMD00019534_015440 [Acytostelium subglobosum LB1]GAM18369.1 hypothetical protein SAMD00019534_015440 [Acytostelium subglobosum LB1]|eukprot:XP_012757589.1 hypothetical protein SAMD00019534_015440 [Acytostelium subglobosum LB1]